MCIVDQMRLLHTKLHTELATRNAQTAKKQKTKCQIVPPPSITTSPHAGIDGGAEITARGMGAWLGDKLGIANLDLPTLKSGFLESAKAPA